MQLKQRLEQLATPLQIEAKRHQLKQLQQQMQGPDFWSNQELAVQVSSQAADLEKLLKQYDQTLELVSAQLDLSPAEQLELEKEVHQLELYALLSGPHDSAAAILTIHAGTGGTDAADWAKMLMRMFLRFVEQGKTESETDQILAINRRNWQVEILEENAAEEAGIKKVVLEVSGNLAYGLLKSEAGVHRLVRQSPFNAKGLRQTSFALVEVLPEVSQQEAPEIKDTELKIDIFKSGGAGGQHVNTTESAVRITHLPTNIVVTIQNERSQHQNKATALKILQAKLAALQTEQNQAELAKLKGEVKEGSWGNQIRSYVLHPYQLVKDHRTNCETSNTAAVLDGQLKPFIESYLTSKITHG